MLIEFNYKNSLNDYLRGYEVLDKERELLQNRSLEEVLLSNSDYAKLKNALQNNMKVAYFDYIKEGMDKGDYNPLLALLT